MIFLPLPTVEPPETILYSARGQWSPTTFRGAVFGRNEGWIVLTNRRLILRSWRWFFWNRTEDVYLSDIDTIETTKQLGIWQLLITVADEQVSVLPRGKNILWPYSSDRAQVLANLIKAAKDEQE